MAQSSLISASKVCKGLTSLCSSSEAEELAISLSSQKTLSLLTTVGGPSSWLPVEEGRGKSKANVVHLLNYEKKLERKYLKHCHC